jgi:putative flippase GtrA
MIKKLKDIYEKHKLIIRYLFFGFITTVLSLVACYVTVKCAALVWHDENGDPNAIADSLGSITQWIVGVLVAFFTNKLWVFTNAEKGARATFKQLFVFSSSRVGTFFIEWSINLGIIALLDDLFNYNAPTIPLGFMDFELSSRIWAKVISSIIVVITNYYISKLIVFRKKNQATK